MAGAERRPDDRFGWGDDPVIVTPPPDKGREAEHRTVGPSSVVGASFAAPPVPFDDYTDRSAHEERGDHGHV